MSTMSGLHPVALDTIVFGPQILQPCLGPNGDHWGRTELNRATPNPYLVVLGFPVARAARIVRTGAVSRGFGGLGAVGSRIGRLAGGRLTGGSVNSFFFSR